MGLAKRMMEERDANKRIARDVLVAYDYITCCEAHEQYSSDGCDPLADGDDPGSDLPNIIADMRSEGFTGDDDEARDAIQDAMADTGMGCVPCAKIAAE